MKSFGMQLRVVRENRKLTQEQLGLLSGISRNTISEIETNKHSNTTIYVLCSFCKALNLTPNDLIPKELYEVKNGITNNKRGSK